MGWFNRMTGWKTPNWLKKLDDKLVTPFVNNLADANPALNTARTVVKAGKKAVVLGKKYIPQPKPSNPIVWVDPAKKTAIQATLDWAENRKKEEEPEKYDETGDPEKKNNWIVYAGVILGILTFI